MARRTDKEPATKSRLVWERATGAGPTDQFTLGPVVTESLLRDPKHLAFRLARYKFAVKMLGGARHVVEIGCGEGLGALIFLAETRAKITAVDFDEQQIAYARAAVLPHGKGRLSLQCQDILTHPLPPRSADGLVCLDVIEHIDPAEEAAFIDNVAACLEPYGVAVIGTPNLHAHQWASERNRKAHINLFDDQRLAAELGKRFRRIFSFSMNDEVVHTGFSKMAHYLFALCVK